MMVKKNLFEMRVVSLTKILPKWLMKDPDQLRSFLRFLNISLNLNTTEDLPSEDTLVKALTRYTQENKIEDEPGDVQSVIEKFCEREGIQTFCKINPINLYKKQCIKNNITVIGNFVSSLKKKCVKHMSYEDDQFIFQSQLPVQIALRRIIDLLLGMKKCMFHGLLLPTVLCSRSLLETCADLSIFLRNFEEVLKKGEFDKVSAVVDIHIRKTRDPEKYRFFEIQVAKLKHTIDEYEKKNPTLKNNLMTFFCHDEVSLITHDDVKALLAKHSVKVKNEDSVEKLLGVFCEALGKSDLAVFNPLNFYKNLKHHNLLAKNVMTQISYFDKNYCPGVEQLYGILSNICHPNYEGNFDLYAELVDKTVHFNVEDKSLDLLIERIVELIDPLKKFGEIINKIRDVTLNYRVYYVQHFTN